MKLREPHRVAAGMGRIFLKHCPWCDGEFATEEPRDVYCCITHRDNSRKSRYRARLYSNGMTSRGTAASLSFKPRKSKDENREQWKQRCFLWHQRRKGLKNREKSDLLERVKLLEINSCRLRDVMMVQLKVDPRLLNDRDPFRQRPLSYTPESAVNNVCIRCGHLLPGATGQDWDLCETCV